MSLLLLLRPTTPGDAVDAIPGLAQRWRADTITASDGAAVTSWTERRGGATLTAAGASTTYQTAGIGGQPALSFTFANNARLTATVNGGDTAATFVMVLKPNAINSQRNLLHNGMEILADAVSYQAYNGALLAGVADMSAATVLTVVFNGATSTIYSNGTLVASGSAGSNSRSATMILGGHPDLGDRAFDGLIAEVVCFQGALTDTQRQSIDSYAATRYGVGAAPVAVTADAALSGSGTLTVSTSSAVTVAAGTTGSGTLTASGAPALSRAAALTGTGTLTATSTPAVTAAVELSGSGSLTSAATVAGSRAATLTGSGTLSATATPSTSVAVALTSSGTVTATASPALAAPAALSGTGALTATAQPSVTVTATLSGSGTLTASTATGLTVSAAAAGTGVLTATSTAGAVVRTAALAGSGTLAATASPSLTTAASVTGSGTLAASTSQALTTTAALTGSGTLTGSAAITRGVALSGSGTLTATTTSGLQAAADLTGAGTLTATSAIALSAAANLQAAGVLTAGVATVIAAQLGGAGTLTARVIRDITLHVGPLTARALVVSKLASRQLQAGLIQGPTVTARSTIRTAVTSTSTRHTDATLRS